MAMYSSDQSVHRDGHTFGDRGKRTSIGNGRRKRGSYKKGNGKKAYRGQGPLILSANFKLCNGKSVFPDFLYK